MAYFNAAAEPLRLESVSPAVIGDDSTANDGQITGTGFTPQRRSPSRCRVTELRRQSHLRVTVNRGASPPGTANRLCHQRDQSWLLGGEQFAGDGSCCWCQGRCRADEYYKRALDYYFLTGRALDKSISIPLPAGRAPGTKSGCMPPKRGNTTAGAHFFARVAAVAAPRQSLSPRAVTSC